MKLTHEAFLRDMYEYYSADTSRRAINEEARNCYYRQNMPDGTVKKCAIGRHIPDELYDKRIENNSVGAVLMNKMCPDIAHLDVKFLNKVQQFHDESRHWVDEQTSRKRFEELLEIAKTLDQ